MDFVVLGFHHVCGYLCTYTTNEDWLKLILRFQLRSSFCLAEFWDPRASSSARIPTPAGCEDQRSFHTCPTGSFP